MINLIERYNSKNYRNYFTEYYKVPTSTALFNRLAIMNYAKIRLAIMKY